MTSEERKWSSRAAGLRRALVDWEPGASVQEQFLELLCNEFGAVNTCSFSPRVCEGGWKLEGELAAGSLARSRLQSLRRAVANMPSDQPFAACYDPYEVTANQRNVALTLLGLERIGVLDRSAVNQVGDKVLGFAHDALRALICDGPLLVGWVGVIREEPFRSVEIRVMQQLIEPLGRHLRLARQMRSAGVCGAALEVALDALEVPAFVVAPGFRIELANAAGRVRLVQDRRALFADLQAAAREEASNAFTITHLVGVGTSGYVLAVGKQGATRRAVSLARARTLWKLSPKQLRVLELVAQGRANKEIAIALDCAEVTVEQHLTQMFRRVGVRSRTELVAKLATF